MFAAKYVGLLKRRVAIQAVGSRIGFKVCWRGGLVCECFWPPIRISVNRCTLSTPQHLGLSGMEFHFRVRFSQSTDGERHVLKYTARVECYCAFVCILGLP